MKKPKQKPDLYSELEYNRETQQFFNKVQIVSLFHKTGQIRLITNNGKEIKIKLADLVSELKVERDLNVIQNDCQMFEDPLIIKYPHTRSEEFDKIVLGAKIIPIDTTLTDLGEYQVKARINNMIEVVNPIGKY